MCIFSIQAARQIWDADMADDFLGECLLPPLGSLSASSKRYVLPVLPAPPEKGSTRGWAPKKGPSGTRLSIDRL